MTFLYNPTLLSNSGHSIEKKKFEVLELIKHFRHTDFPLTQAHTMCRKHSPSVGHRLERAIEM